MEVRDHRLVQTVSGNGQQNIGGRFPPHHCNKLKKWHRYVDEKSPTKQLDEKIQHLYLPL